MINRPRRASLQLLVAAVLAVGLPMGCQTADPQPSPPAATEPATQPATEPTASSSAATRPAVASTQPATPDPREAAYLTEVTQLTDGFDRAGEGYFSNDMKWIIFQATPKGEKEYQMYVASLEMGDGSAPKIGTPVRISPKDSRNTCGYFSPDGKTVIFGSTAGKEKPDEQSAGYQRQGGNYRWAFPDGMEIYAADWQAEIKERTDLPAEYFAKEHNARAGEAAPDFGVLGVTNFRIDLALPANRLTDNKAYDAEGSYSADGKWIVFTSRRSGDTELWAMKADGSNPVQLTKAPGYDGGPFFAPDGKRILYRSDRKGNDLLQIFVADLAFNAKGDVTGIEAEHQVTNDANVNWGPYFHPDNKHVIYATSVHGHHNYELYLMKDDGSQKTRITWCAGFDGLPVFSPDGKHLMWSAKRSEDGTTQLFIARFKLPPTAE